MCIRWLISGALEQEPRGRTWKFFFLDPYYIGYIKRTFIMRKKLPPYLCFPRFLSTFKLYNLLLFNIYLYIFIYYIYYIINILFACYVSLAHFSVKRQIDEFQFEHSYCTLSIATQLVSSTILSFLPLIVCQFAHKKNIQSDSWECTSAKQKRTNLDYKRSIWVTIYVMSRYTVRAEFRSSVRTVISSANN